MHRQVHVRRNAATTDRHDRVGRPRSGAGRFASAARATVPPTNDEIAERVRALAAPVIDDHAVELVDVEVRGAHGSRVVRIVGDSDDGLDLDLIAELSREIGDLLDEDDFIGAKYTLEVSSPGVDRPLRTPTSFRRNIGRDVRVVRNRDAIDRGQKGELTGTLEAVDDRSLTLTVDGDTVTVPHDDVDHGKVVLPW